MEERFAAENAPVCPEPIENVLLPLAALCLSLTVEDLLKSCFGLHTFVGQDAKWILVKNRQDTLLEAL